MAKLSKTKILHTSLSLEEWKSALFDHVEEVESFSIVAKLSAGGVVVRTLRAPKSDLPFFGMVGDKLQIAELRYTHNLTPYQPLLTMQYTPEDSGGRVEVQLTPHPEMMDLGVLYNIAGVILIGSTIPMMSIKPQLSVIAGVFGILLLIYPSFRARVSFDEACASATQNLERLPLGWNENQGTAQGPSQ